MNIPQWLRDLACQSLAECEPDACGKELNLLLDPEQLRPAVSKFLEKGYFLEDVTGADVQEGFLVLYHFAHFDLPGRYSLMVRVAHDTPVLPTIADIYQGANWHERECFDMYGLLFTGHPNLLPLLLPAETDLHPLIKTDKKRAPLNSVLPFCHFVDTSTGEESADSPEEKAQ
jgi:NADH-quinone oxidoreductase subunit C